MRLSLVPLFLAGTALSACGGVGTGPSTNTPLCSTPTPVNLAVGETRLVDALRESSCVDLPGGAVEREYLVALYSAEGQESANGVSGPVGTRTSPTAGGTALVASRAAPEASIRQDLLGLPALATASGDAGAFHQMLRAREGVLARSPLARMAVAEARLVAPRPVPVLGERDTFNVCRTTACTTFERVGATVRYVGQHGVIYLDDSLPAAADGLTPSDIGTLGALFDEYLYPIDTTAFGRESDINGDQRVAILISDAVNALTTDCSGGRIVGYFFGGDLITSYPGSNRREVFYAFAPVLSRGNCPPVSRSQALRALPPVLIHELQHMISFNQHVLRRNGNEETLWLNEGLSHYAEELGFRVIPDGRCPNSASCFSEFMAGNLFNGYQYLQDPPVTHLIAPTRPGGPLAERGATWLFVSWLSDHFAADTLRGTQITRALVQTNATGAQNVQAGTGVPFATLLGQWHLANYVENLPGFPQQGRLRYRSFDLRDIYGRNSPQVFERPYPLVPPMTSGTINRTTTLSGGSAAHLLVTVPAGVGGITVRVNGASDVTRVPAVLDPRIAVVRIR